MLNLTQHEQKALDSLINLSDGHPRQALTHSQRAIVTRLPEFFELVQNQPLAKLEACAQSAFFSSLGQLSAPIRQGRVLSAYSSSVATMIVAKVLRGHRVALLHPTFDNIHALLSWIIQVVPLDEGILANANLSDQTIGSANCIFVTIPNNPTGWIPGPTAFDHLAKTCAARGLVLCVDASFRGFDTRAYFDMYDILERNRTEYIVIEDTGKLWPLQELKLGFLATSAGMEPVVRDALSDVLLSVSPLLLRLVEAFATDAAEGGLMQLHGLIEQNRCLVQAAISDIPEIQLVNPDSNISVCLLRFNSAASARQAHLAMLNEGVHVLPCSQFYWARQQEGADMLRIALSRDPEVLAHGLCSLQKVAGLSEVKQD